MMARNNCCALVLSMEINPTSPPSKEGWHDVPWANLGESDQPTDATAQQIQLPGQHREMAETAWLTEREKGKNIQMSTNLQVICYLLSLSFTQWFFFFFTKIAPSSEDTNKHGYKFQLPQEQVPWVRCAHQLVHGCAAFSDSWIPAIATSFIQRLICY